MFEDFCYHAAFALDYSKGLFEDLFCHAESPQDFFGNSDIITCSIINYLLIIIV